MQAVLSNASALFENVLYIGRCLCSAALSIGPICFHLWSIHPFSYSCYLMIWHRDQIYSFYMFIHHWIESQKNSLKCIICPRWVFPLIYTFNLSSYREISIQASPMSWVAFRNTQSTHRRIMQALHEWRNFLLGLWWKLSVILNIFWNWRNAVLILNLKKRKATFKFACTHAKNQQQFHLPFWSITWETGVSASLN